MTLSMAIALFYPMVVAEWYLRLATNMVTLTQILGQIGKGHSQSYGQSS